MSVDIPDIAEPADTAEPTSNVSVWVLDGADGTIEFREARNVSCVGGHELMLESVRPSGRDVRFDAFAVGSGGSTGTNVDDRSLNSPEATGRIYNDTQSGRTATFRGFLPGQVTVSQSVDEVGLLTGEDGDLVNHAVISPVEVTEETVLIFEADITLNDPSES